MPHSLTPAEQAELKRLETIVDKALNDNAPLAWARDDSDRVAYARHTLLRAYESVLKTGQTLVEDIKTWLPIKGKNWSLARVSGAEQVLRRVRDSAFIFETLALAPCLLLTKPELRNLQPENGGPLCQIVRRIFNDPVCGQEFAGCLESWPELHLALAAVVSQYKPVASHYGLDAEVWSNSLCLPPPLPFETLEGLQLALTTLANAIELFRPAALSAIPPLEKDEAEDDRDPGPPFVSLSPLSALDLAKILGKPLPAVDSFLRRYRGKAPDCFIKVDDNDRRRNQPKYLYRHEEVLPALKEHFAKKKSEGRKPNLTDERRKEGRN